MQKYTFSLVRYAIPVLMAALTCGCMKINPVYYSTLDTELTYSGRCKVAVAVQDARSRVVNGETTQSTIGEIVSASFKRSPLTTDDGRSLAEITADAVINAFSKKGFDVLRISTSPVDTPEAIMDKVNNSSPDHSVVITINEWWSSVLKNADLAYDLTLVLYDSKGEVLVEISEQGNKAFMLEAEETAETSTEDLGWGADTAPPPPPVEEPSKNDQDAFPVETTTEKTETATKETDTEETETEEAETEEVETPERDLNHEIFLFYQHLVKGMLNDPRMPKLMDRFDTGKTQEKPSATEEALAPAGTF